MGGSSSKKQTVGYKYFLSVHAILTHGPVDRILRLQFDKKDAWVGDSTGGQLNVYAPELFGGDKKEGGVSGQITFAPGAPDQMPNAHLQSIIGASLPAFRGVAGLVFGPLVSGLSSAGFYFGMNPYLKPWSVRLQRIHKTTDGATQWNDAVAEIPAAVDRQPVGGPVWRPRNTGYFVVGASQEIDGVYRNPTDQSWLDGYIDSLRITKGVARYTTKTFTPPNAPFNQVDDPYWNETLAAVLYHNGVAIDLKGNPVSALISTDTSKFGTTSAKFTDTVGSYGRIDVGVGNDDLGGTFTIEAWVYINGPSSGPYASPILSAGAINVSGYDTDFYVGIDRFLHFIQTGEVPNTNLAGMLNKVSYGRWTFVTLTRDNVSGLYYMHADGRLVTGTSTGANMNPVHIIRECLTDPDWGMGYLASDIDDASFLTAADTLADEYMGMSLLWDRQMAIEDFIKIVVQHIDAALFVSRTTGKFILKLIRNDYIPDSLLVLDVNNANVSDYSYRAFGELVNAVTVNYWDDDNNAQGSVTVSDPALVQDLGAIGTTVQYPGFTNKDLAAQVALRDLVSLSSPLRSATIYAGITAANLNIGDPFKLDWPDFSDTPIIMRVIGLALGDGKSNQIRITATEDRFALPSSGATAPPATQWTDPVVAPIPATVRVVMETPYYELVQRQGQTIIENILGTSPESGYLMVTAQRPEAAIRADIRVDDGGGYDDQGMCDFSPAATLVNSIGYMDTVLDVVAGPDFNSVEDGTYALMGNELIKIVSVTDTTVIVGRGVLDTVPGAHAAGTAIIFVDVYAEVVNKEYVLSETINVKLLPTTGAGTLDIADATADALMFAQRAFRPYAPGNLKINGSYFPLAILGAASFTWSHRDRKQQTSGDLVVFTDGNVGPEAGTTYTLEIYGETDALLRTATGLTGTSYDYAEADEKSDSNLTAGDAPPPPATAIRSAMGATLTGTQKWYFSVRGDNGRIYGVPLEATDILIIDPEAGTATRSTMGATLTGTLKWIGGAKAANGKIYCVPYNAPDILIIDPGTGTASRSTMGLPSMTDLGKWVGAVLGSDGKIYGVPDDSPDILIIDPVAGTAIRSTMGATLTGTQKWRTGVAGLDGKIYCPPYNATDILIIDPVAGTAIRSTMGATLTGTQKWNGSVGANNRIYAVPYDATDILIIDPVAGTAIRSAMGATLTGSAKWLGGALANGRIYCIPVGATDLLIIDPVMGTASRDAMGLTLSDTNKFTGATVSMNGVLYGNPYSSETVLVIEPRPFEYDLLVNEDSPSVFYKFWEVSGTTAYDQSGNARNGTYVNGPLLQQPGIFSFDKGVHYDGINDRVTVPALTSLVASGFTVEVIGVLDDTTVGRFFELTGQAPYCVLIPNYIAGGFHVQVGSVGGINVSGVDCTQPHVFTLVQETTGAWEIYVDGVQKGSGTSNGIQLTPANNYIGVAVDGATQPLKGTTVRFAWHAAPLTPARIALRAAAARQMLLRLNNSLHIRLSAQRDALDSFQSHDYTFDRAGYGFNYGKYYGGV